MNTKKINLIKKNCYLAIVVVVLLFVIGFAFAEYTPSKASHEVLYTNQIEPKSGTDINLIGNVLVNGMPFGMGSVIENIKAKIESYDKNRNDRIDEFEIINAIDDWTNLKLSDRALQVMIHVWGGAYSVSGLPQSTGVAFYNIFGTSSSPSDLYSAYFTGGKGIMVNGNIKASGTVCDKNGCIGSGGPGGADTDWVESGGNVYRATGNVGIGTTTPNEKLSVEGVISLKEQIGSPSTTSGYGKIYAKEPNGVDSYVKLLLHMDTDFKDSSYSAHSPTTQGDARIIDSQSVFGKAAYFDGTTDNVYYPDSEDWNFGSSDFTIDFWVRWDGAPGATGFLGQSNGGGTTYKWGLYWNTNEVAGNKFGIHSWDNTLTRRDVVWDWVPSANTWYHLAIVRSGSNWYFFVNGVQTGGTQSKSYTLSNSFSVLRIGYDGEMHASFKGYMDEIRISKGIARWTSNFIPPSSAYHGGGLFYMNSKGQEIEICGGS